jgi:3-deoxy-manno-octulosonate cytidylyltransferase (CMP-KDO synthetase)
MKAIAVIPARLASTRLPRKALREIAGIPLIGHVYRTVRSSPLVQDVIIATDSDEIVRVCRQNGWDARMTLASHRSGTERVHEISNSIEADVYINVQGDEPMTRSEHIAALLGLMENPAVEVGTLKTRAAAEDINNPAAVKVVTDSKGRALYFSRATIPYNRDGSTPVCFKHLGLYVYRKPALDRFVQLPESSLERSERLEQLRFLENGISICVAETPYDTVGVDTEEDLRRVEQILRKRETYTWDVEVCGRNPEACFPQFCAAATRLEIEGWEWKSHSTHFDGERSARFCSASLFMEVMNGATLGIDLKA